MTCYARSEDEFTWRTSCREQDSTVQPAASSLIQLGISATVAQVRTQIVYTMFSKRKSMQQNTTAGVIRLHIDDKNTSLCLSWSTRHYELLLYAWSEHGFTGRTSCRESKTRHECGSVFNIDATVWLSSAPQTGCDFSQREKVCYTNAGGEGLTER